MEDFDYSAKEKEKIGRLFNQIAPSYDFLNHFLSFSLDRKWRKRVVKLLPTDGKVNILDVSTGTGDMAIAIASNNTNATVIGVDIAEQMLAIGKQKLERKNLNKQVNLQLTDAENLPFENESFNYCTVAFGVRNFEHTSKGLAEMYRVLKSGGKLIVLEFSNPRSFPFRYLYAFYSKNILPFIGRLVSNNKAAYTYLPESVKAFPCGDDFVKLLSKSGFIKTSFCPLSCGIVTIYIGVK